MLVRTVLAALIVTGFLAPALAAEPDDLGPAINIMKPEPGPAKKKSEPSAAAKKSPRKARGSSNPVYPVPLPGPQKPAPVPRIDTARPPTRTPPDLVVPQTGRVVPNLPAPGSAAGGRETFSDRSARCINQAGAYGGGLTGDRDSYIRSCINQ